MLPNVAILEIFDLVNIPPFNQDIEMDMPSKVKEFKSKIREADAILIATPKYNYSVPGVLKTPLIGLQDHTVIIRLIANRSL